MRKVLFALACWATIGLANSRADVSYRYVADKSAYLGAAVGDIVPVQLFLQETVTGTSTSLIFRDNGLFGAAVKVNSPGGVIWGTNGDFKITGNQAFSPAGFGNSTGTAGATVVDQVPATATQSGLIINADIAGTAAPGPKVASGGPGINMILLGTLNVKVGATPESMTVTPYGGSFNTITQVGADDLDFGTQQVNGYTGASNNPLGNFSFTVAVVPEPSSMALCGLVACGMSYAGYRRRKATAAEPAPVA